MSSVKSIREIFHLIIKDKMIIFLLIASLLITLSSIVYYKLHVFPDEIYRSIIIGVSYSFSWVVVAWAITDRSIFRKVLPYLSIFVLLFLDKIYWGIFYYFNPPLSISDLAILENYNEIDSWNTVYENAYYFHIFVKFLIVLIVFIIFWYLTRPKDFKQKTIFFKKKKMVYVILASFFMTMSLWFSRLLFNIFGTDLIHSVISDNFSSSLFYFVTGGVLIIISLLFFSLVITNIKTNKKFILYGLVALSVFIYSVPLYNFGLWKYSEDIILTSIYFVIYAICYFVIFLCFLLLSKTKYIEQ